MRASASAPNLHYPSEKPRLEEDDRDEVADHHGADGVEHKVLDFGLSVEAPVRGEQGVQDQGEKEEDVLGDLAGLLSGRGLNDLLRGIRDVLGELGLRGGNPRCWRGVSGASAMGEVEVGVSKGMPSYLFRKRGVRNRDDAGDQKILLNCRDRRSLPFRGPGRHSRPARDPRRESTPRAYRPAGFGVRRGGKVQGRLHLVTRGALGTTEGWFAAINLLCAGSTPFSRSRSRERELASSLSLKYPITGDDRADNRIRCRRHINVLRKIEAQRKKRNGNSRCVKGEGIDIRTGFDYSGDSRFCSLYFVLKSETCVSYLRCGQTDMLFDTVSEQFILPYTSIRVDIDALYQLELPTKRGALCNKP